MQSKPMHTIASTIQTSGEEEFDSNQLSVHKTSPRHSSKLTTVLEVDGVALKMEIDTGAELSTIPVAIYQQKLLISCPLLPADDAECSVCDSAPRSSFPQS